MTDTDFKPLFFFRIGNIFLTKYLYKLNAEIYIASVLK